MIWTPATLQLPSDYFRRRRQKTEEAGSLQRFYMRIYSPLPEQKAWSSLLPSLNQALGISDAILRFLICCFAEPPFFPDYGAMFFKGYLKSGWKAISILVVLFGVCLNFCAGAYLVAWFILHSWTFLASPGKTGSKVPDPVQPGSGTTLQTEVLTVQEISSSGNCVSCSLY